MIVAGFDLSSRKMAVVWSSVEDDEDLIINWHETHWSTSAVSGRPYAQRCLNMKNAVEEWLSMVGPDQEISSFIESPFIHPKRPSGAMSTIMTSGAAQATLKSAGSDVRLVEVAKWKKSIVGNGNASKAQIAAHLINEIGVTDGLTDDQDLTDAACVFLWGIKTLESEGRM